MLIRLFLIVLISPVVMAETCMSQAQLFGIIFGSVGVTLFIAAAIAVLLWSCLRKKLNVKSHDKAAYTNAACDVAERGCDAQKRSQKDQMTMIDSYKLKRKLDVGTQKAYSMEHINEVDGQVGVQLKSEDLSGLGFNIQGNMTGGIYISSLLPKGPADLCGNIVTGDRIKSLTISFDGMVYSDAVTLLSYASPYKVKLELERKLEDVTVADNSATSPRIHPLFRSNTLTNCHFGNGTGFEPMKSASVETTQKHGRPSVEQIQKKEEVTVPAPNPHKPRELVKPVEVAPDVIEEIKKEEQTESSLPDSTTGDHVISNATDADVSKMESSDYASDNTSDYRESLSEKCTGTESVASTEEISQHTISDRMEITDLIVDRPVLSPVPPSKIEYCATLPPKQKKVVTRSPSPAKITSRIPTPPPPKKDPVPRVFDLITPPKQQSEKKEAPKSRIPPPSPPRMAPEITESRISRIPKRTDSLKTPVLERKLPNLPRSVTQRSHSAEDNKGDNVWSRLYQEKKGTLRRSRDPGAPVPGALSPTLSPNNPLSPNTSQASPITTPKSQRSVSSDRYGNYGTLSRDKRDRLQANQDTLDRQRDELRKLGIL